MQQRKKFVIANRMDTIDASGVRKMFDLAVTMDNPINFSIGQPDFDVPDPIKEAAKAAISGGMNKYTQTQGMPELREAIWKQASAEFGWTNPGDHPILVTCGVSGALLLAIKVLVNPGDEVIMPDPHFVMYRHLVNFADGVPVCIDTYPDFHLDAQKIADAITPRTKILLLNSPANPTGAVYSRQEMEDIAEVARNHELLVISDEVYNIFCYDEPYLSFAHLYDHTLLMRGFSKTYAMTGWRIGWCTGPPNVIDKMTMLQQYSFVCAPSVAQAAILTALKTDMTQYVNAYRKKRDMVCEILGEKFDLVKPGGAFYAFVPAPKGMDATDFVYKAIEHQVLVIPGNVFSSRDTHFRISYATTDEKLFLGLRILCDLV
ncbi:MAG: aminotransferase class I/II-fold pyridoxal phosphate-dependent enzyme [bacterium]|nr:aminotransferase class I/II-fold pyridoxal phosphate-dependent enzyme [Candidatus Sumerlaeota bacterium]